MKKILGICTIAVLAVACQKKAEHPLQDSNVMLEEPAQVTVTDSSSKPTTDAAAAKAAVQAKDSAATPAPASGTTPANNAAAPALTTANNK